MRLAFSVLVALLLLSTVALVPALAQEGPDEVESNDTMDLADLIDGNYIEGEIGRHRDNDDWYVLDGQEGTNPTFILTYDDRECDIDLEIYSDEEFIGSLTSTTSPDEGDFNIPGVCYLHVYVYDGYGEYQIEIIAGNDRGRDRDRVRARDCEGPDENEWNDSADAANYIEGENWGLEISGYACESEDDWFVLDGTEGTYPEIIIYYDDSVVDIDMMVLSDEEVVGNLSSSYSPDSNFFHISGECYLHVYAFSGEGDYYIEIFPGTGRDGDHARVQGCEGPDEVESNDTRDLAGYIDTPEISGIACEGDEDWFVLDGSEGNNPEFIIYYEDDFCDIDMEVYSDNEYIGTLNSTISPDSGSFRVTGECYLYVFSYDGDGDYFIEITPGHGSSGDHRPPNRECAGADEIEPNDNVDQSDFIADFVIEGYACEGDTDWFELAGQEGTNPVITITYDDYDFDVDIDIWSDNEIAGSLTSGSSPDSGEFNITGTCWLEVYAFEGEGMYSIEISPEGEGGSDRPSRQSNCQGPSEVEPNDDYENADWIDTYTIEGYACEEDTDWFILDGFEGTNPEITLYYDDTVTDIDMDVWSDDTKVGALTSATSPDVDTFDIPGTCWFMVYAFSGEGSYTIEINP